MKWLYYHMWTAQVIKVAPQVHVQLLEKSCAVSIFASQKKKIAPQVQSQVWRFEKRDSNWLSQLKLR